MYNQRTQTIAPQPLEALRLSGLKASPYFRSDRGAVTEIKMAKALVTGISTSDDGGAAAAQFLLWDDSNNLIGLLTYDVTVSFTDTSASQLRSDILTGIAAGVTRDFSLTITSSNMTYLNDTLESIPMYVSGVAKTGYYAVVGAPSVAGGAGVARFYIDSNGDGTGTAPSAVFSSSLQAVVWNSTAAYIPQSITVDTNRKYIDVKMGTLNFSTGLAGILSVLTGASIANAANGTTVNCLVLVQQ